MFMPQGFTVSYIYSMHFIENNTIGKFDGNSDTHGSKMYNEIVSV